MLFEGVRQVNGPNYTAERGEFVVSRDGTQLARLNPEKRFFPVQQQSTTESAIRTTGFGDLYVVLSDEKSDAGNIVRIYHNPLAPWLWGGAVLMALGGLISLSDRRFRIGVASRQTRAMPPAATPSAAE